MSHFESFVSSFAADADVVVAVGPYVSFNPSDNTLKVLPAINSGILYTQGNVPQQVLDNIISVKQNDSPVTTTSAASGTDNNTSSRGSTHGLDRLSSAAVAGIVATVGVIALIVVGLVVMNAKRRRVGFGYAAPGSVTGKNNAAAKSAMATVAGVPVWEMGQWRVVRADEWAAIEASMNDVSATGDEKKSGKKQVSFSDEESVVINEEQLVDGAEAGRYLDTKMHLAQPVAVDEETADEIDAGGAQRNSTDSNDDEHRTISYSYDLLSKLSASEDGEKDLHYDIQMPSLAALKGPEFLDTSAPRRRL
ncbi:hypothetical protein HDU76_006159 [Blyttiomyces sp. JEL0837]|nr:hypothetical protein HDU76_006159 [Blyttiomyces sp. JEL0837]